MSHQVDISLLRVLGGILLTAGLLLVLVQCDLVEPVEQQSLVVEAFLKTEEELPPVRLRQTRPMDVPGDSLAEAATGAEVELHLDGKRIPYEPADERSGRYLPTEEETIVSEEGSWQLTVQWQDETVQAEGTVPPPIDVTEVCVEVPEAPVQTVLVDSLRRDSLDIPAEQGYIYPIDVTVRWPRDRLAAGADTTHWIRVQLPTATFPSEFVGLFLQPAEVRREDRFSRLGRLREWRGVYAVPVDNEDAPLPSHYLTVALARGDTAFAAFARSRTDPQRREPVSNVQGGLGIATAVAVDSLRRFVASDVERCHRPD